MLNAFEIDGADPFKSISGMNPKDGERHLEIDKGLSWTAGSGAKSHDVYIGTDYNSVYNATKNSAEYKGNRTSPNYALDDSEIEIECSGSDETEALEKAVELVQSAG